MNACDDVVPFDDFPFDDDLAGLEDLAPEADGSALLDEVRAIVTRYVALPSEHAVVAVVLWIVATHAIAVLEHATRLAIHSPVKRCGKSRLLEVIGGLAHNPISTTNISTPALFRMIDAAGEHPPTLLLDEADRLLGSKRLEEDAADLVSLLNNGFRRGSPTWRCVGPRQDPTAFETFSMVAVAGIGRLPDTVEDRAVNITMRRRLPGEHVDKFRLRTDLPALHELRGRISTWIESNRDEIEGAVLSGRDVPDELEDRAQDAWEPLIAVAVAAGGEWPRVSAEAAVALCREAEQSDAESYDLRLLSDVRNAIPANTTFVATANLLHELRACEEAPWSEIDFTARRLATRLGKFGVKPTRSPAGTERGYRVADFRDVFRRYLTSEPSEVSETLPEQGVLV